MEAPAPKRPVIQSATVRFNEPQALDRVIDELRKAAKKSGQNGGLYSVFATDGTVDLCIEVQFRNRHV